MQTILDTNYALTRYLPESQSIEVIWRPHTMTKEEYLSPFRKALEWQVSHPVRFFISDIREQKLVSPDFRKAFQSEIVEKAKAGGLEKGVVIFSGNVFKKYYLNNILNTTKAFGIEFKFFTSRDEALNWLNK